MYNINFKNIYHIVGVFSRVNVWWRIVESKLVGKKSLANG